jgi:hypothetical protein
MDNNPESNLIDLSQLTLGQSATDRKTSALKARLLPQLWNLPADQSLEASDAFVEYYMSQRVLIEAHGLNLHTHQDLIDLINFVRARMGIPQSQLVADFRKEYDSVGPALPAIEVAVRIWLLVSIDDWEPRQSLQEYISVLFPRIDEAPPFLLPDDFAFPLSFNITNLRLIGGFEIVWTECLHDHLSFTVDEEQKKELKIFHLSSFLQGYRYSSWYVYSLTPTKGNNYM